MTPIRPSALVLVALAAIAGLAPVTPAAAAKAHAPKRVRVSRSVAIVPGRAVGKVKIGAPRPDVEAVLGKPDNVTKINADYELATWVAKKFVVGWRGAAERTVLIGVRDPKFVTVPGRLHVGQPLASAKTAFPHGEAPTTAEGAPTPDHPLVGWQDTDAGITFLHRPGFAEEAPEAGTEPSIDEIDVYDTSAPAGSAPAASPAP